ncbi:MAG: hypothetical protein EA398_10960 [Deltaproteobacteria bacterium]|nr:MAG: hypothetical protein EA398_10960 [Deltaproteobacteria bacterium]
MPRLRRVHFASIGHRDARLAPLTLDLRDPKGGAADSVIWLRNGGGKSSILNLFFSVFRPGLGEFLGKAVDGQSRHLADYVKAEDTAFVITEWEVDGTQQGLGLEQPATRILGQVIEWRGRQRSSDTSRLQRRFFTLRTDDVVHWDTLPVHGIMDAPVVSMDAFLDWLRQVRDERPAREVVVEEHQGKWIRHLESIHLDPELFRYQLQMNRREGAADEAFRFATARAFVEFFLELTLDTSRADQVSANLKELREKLQRLPGHRDERAFLQRAVEALGPLVIEADLLRKASEEREACLAAARAVAGGLRDAAVQAETRRNTLDVRLVGLQQRQKELANEERRISRWTEGLERRAVEMDVAEAKEALVRATATRVQAVRHRQLMEAVPRWRDVQALGDRCAHLRARLAEEDQEREPVLALLKQAGSVLCAALDSARRDAEGLAEARDANVQAAQGARAAAQTRKEAAVAAEAEARKDAELLRRQLGERDRERETLVHQAMLAPRESAVDAHTRWAQLRDRAQARRHQAEASKEVLEQEREEVHRRREVLHGEHAATREKERAERQRLDDAQAERARLETDRDVVKLEEEVARADAFSRGLAERLMEAAAAQEVRLRRSAVEGAEDERAAAQWEQCGLLPPAVDVERVLERLRERGIEAHAAQAYLADNLRLERDSKAAMLAADPARFGGVFVSERDMDRVRAIEQLDRGLRTPVMISVSTLQAQHEAASSVVAGPEGAGTYDHAAAATEVSDIRDRRARRQGQEGKLQERSAHLRAMSERVRDFMARWGDGRWEAMCERLDMLGAEAERLAADLQETEQQRDAVAAAIAEVDAEREQAERDQRQATDACRALQAFVESHDRHVDARRQELLGAEKREREAAAAAAVAGDEARAAEERRDQEVRLRDEARSRASALRAEAEAVQWSDGDPVRHPPALDASRNRYEHLLREYDQVFGESRLKWELERAEEEWTRAEHALAAALGDDLSRDEVAALSDVTGDRAGEELQQASDAERQARLWELDAERQVAQSDKALKALPPRVRDAADLPPDEAPPVTAAACRTRAEALREQLEGVRNTSREVSERYQQARADRDESERARAALAGRLTRIAESCDVEAGSPAALPEGDADVEALVKTTIRAVKDANDGVQTAAARVRTAVEQVRALAADPRFGDQPGAWKQRLVDIHETLVENAAPLQRDLRQRIGALDHEIASLEGDRQTLLTSLLAVADDGVDLLRATERASRLPDALGRWAGQSFLKVSLDVPAGDEERRARLGPLVDELVEKASIPGGLSLVQQSVMRLHGSRPLQATILKPEATRRLDRVDIVAMSNFSGGERLTAAVLLYCTLVRLRARRRGRGQSYPGNVLLLDNPIGTCSSVPLIELQREVARAMDTQLLYTTGVDDLAALAQLPNVVRLRNAHRNRATGDQHVTEAEGEITGVRIVRREQPGSTP